MNNIANREFSIVEMQRPCRGSVAERASWEIDHFAPPSDGAGRGPVTMEDFSLPSAIGWRGVFFNEVQLHRELADLAFQRRDLRLILGNDAGFGLFIVQFAPIELRQPTTG
ncbi:hypothetical protein [Neorhizobium sp. DT-125]|uniref:hypothetical protein n=1 Tax=Neorhizobium sp. DT-125 TaxID=3396163 RepID=UPI003F195EEF